MWKTSEQKEILNGREVHKHKVLICERQHLINPVNLNFRVFTLFLIHFNLFKFLWFL